MKQARRLVAAVLATWGIVTACAAAPQAALESALASPARPAADVAQDERRKSREVLAFLGVKPGMRVMDVFSAGGFNTELLARTVGVKGQVIAYNNPPYARFAEKGIAARYADDRLGNVHQVMAEVGELPGGVVVVQDHVAMPGGDAAAVVDKLHRIDPDLVKRDFERAGFVFDASSDVLAHASDDHTRQVFDESIRGQTDQFVYRFRKPMP